MSRLRLALLALLLALAVPVVALVARALSSIEFERRVRHEAVAERVFDEMERALTRFLEHEEARPAEEYRFYSQLHDGLPEGDPAQIRSPLSRPSSFSDETSCQRTESALFTAPVACDTCAVPQNQMITLDSLAPNQVFLQWDVVPDAFKYFVRGRKAGTGNFRFVSSNSNQKVVSILKPSTWYSWSVSAYCPYDSSDFSPEDTFMTFPPPRLGADGAQRWIEEIRLYPNPAVDRADLEFLASESTELFFRIVDARGAVLRNWSEPVWEGPNRIPLSFAELPTGLYSIELRTESRRHSVRVVLSR